MTTWRVPVALITLIAFPLIAGSARLIELSGGPALLPANPRIAASPAPLVVHVLGAAVYAVAGAFQFSARLGRTHLVWHRRAGRVLVVAGLAVAGSGLWMTVFYAGAPGGALLWFVRLVVGCGMAACLVLGVAAVRRRDIRVHRAWMIRAYALAVAAGTQVVTQGVGEALSGTSDLSTALSVSSGWVVNLAAAEWIIRRPATLRRAIRRARHAQPGSRVVSPDHGDLCAGLSGPGRGSPRSALGGVVREPRSHPGDRRHDDAAMRRPGPGRAAWPAGWGPRPWRPADLRQPGQCV